MPKAGSDCPDGVPAADIPGRDPWLGVELRHLAALEAVASERSFRGAAQRLGYVQSAVSQQIAMLERRVGTRLVERSRGTSGVGLTLAGEALVVHAGDVMRRLKAAQADLRSLSAAEPVRFGLEADLASRLLPRLIGQVERDPLVPRVEVTEVVGDRCLLRQLEAGDIDAAVAELPIEPDTLDWAQLFEDPLVLVVERDSRLGVRGGPLTPEDLADVTVIGTRAATSVEARLTALGCQPILKHVAQSDATAQRLAGAGIGAAIMPRLSVDLADPSITVLELANMLAPRMLVLVRDRLRVPDPCLASFEQALRRSFAAIDPDGTNMVA
jgi:DNA-binding transcriptional LysR family regulator